MFHKHILFKRENQSTQRYMYKRGEVYIRGFELNTVHVLFPRVTHSHCDQESAIKKNLILVISYLLEFIENLKP